MCPVPALSTQGVTADVGGVDPGPGAVADLTSHQRVAAKRLGLTLGALGTQCPRGTDTVSGHRFTQPAATVTSCSRGQTNTSSEVRFCLRTPCLKTVKLLFVTQKLRELLTSAKLTSAVGEPPVARGAHGAVSANHVGSAAALPAERLAGVALRSDLVTRARHRPVVEEGRQGHGRAETEPGGGGGTGAAREEESADDERGGVSRRLLL